MQRKDLLEKYKNEAERLLVAKLLDKIELCEKRSKIEYTDFLDEYQETIALNVLRILNIVNFKIYGGFENAERKIIIFFPEKFSELFECDIFNYNTIFSVIRIIPNNEEITHRIYLGGLIKLGVKREKIGDILVHSDFSADIIINKEIEKFLISNIEMLKRFRNCKIELIKLNELKIEETKMKEEKIIVSSLRLDNVISEICKTSRNKANEIILAQRVFINNQNVTKNTKIVQESDKITIRGKGKFFIEQILDETKKGKIPILIKFY